MSILSEIVAMREDVVPEVSLRAHLFNEMVEMDILYFALFPSRENNALNEQFLLAAPNRIADLMPDAVQWADTVHVINTPDLDGGVIPMLNANTLEQRVACFVERP